VQAVRQQARGIPAWAMDDTPFQVTDQASTDRGLFGQFFLGHVGGETEALEELAERQQRCRAPGLVNGVHAGCPEWRSALTASGALRS
jgi:hypothetical protein